MIKKYLLHRSERMVSIHFEKLFSRFNYNVILNKKGLTILTGPNGYGKSTILKSIEALGKELIGIRYFFSLDFKKITAKFEDNQKITIEKNDDKLTINKIPIENNIFKEDLEDIISRRPYFARLDEDTWLDRRRGTTLSLNEYFVEQYSRELRSTEEGADSKEHMIELLDLLKRMKQLIGEIYFIREQRLIRESKGRRDETEVINVIEELPVKFKDLMRSVQQDYSTEANRLDSTYPNRLFENEEKITEEDYKVKMQGMALKFETLSKYDLSTMQSSANFVFKEEHSKALKIYFDDFDTKYHVYEDFIKKLDLYTDIINDRLSFKELRISREFGISIVDEQSKQLKLTQLSSGEKQEIVLFYELIFGTQKNVLLLIDEPEISLHITWQKKFMDDLLRIIEYKGFNVIVATHSPQIINEHWDRQIDLGELYGEQLNKR